MIPLTVSPPPEPQIASKINKGPASSCPDTLDATKHRCGAQKHIVRPLPNQKGCGVVLTPHWDRERRARAQARQRKARLRELEERAERQLRAEEELRQPGARTPARIVRSGNRPVLQLGGWRQRRGLRAPGVGRCGAELQRADAESGSQSARASTAPEARAGVFFAPSPPPAQAGDPAPLRSPRGAVGRRPGTAPEAAREGAQVLILPHPPARSGERLGMFFGIFCLKYGDPHTLDFPRC